MKYLDNLIAWGDSLFRAGHDRDDQRGDPAATCWPPTCSGHARSASRRAGSRARQDLRQLKAGGLDASATRWSSWRASSRSTSALRRPVSGGDAERRRPAVRHRAHALLLRPAQRQAARLLGHGRRPAVQDPPLHEHRGRRAPARAVRPADRPRHAGQGGRGRHRHRQHRQRAQPADRPGALPAADPEGARAVQRGAQPRAARCSRRSRRATASSSRCMRQTPRDPDPADDAGRAVPAVASGPGGDRVAAHHPRQRRWSGSATTSGCSGYPPTPTRPTTYRCASTAASSTEENSTRPTPRSSASTTSRSPCRAYPQLSIAGRLVADGPVRRARDRASSTSQHERGRRAQHSHARRAGPSHAGRLGDQRGRRGARTDPRRRRQHCILGTGRHRP